MTRRFDSADLDGFTVAMVLERFGVAHSHGRACCPICQSHNPQSFAFGGKMFGYNCFVCGAKGNQVQLYAALAGIPQGRAVAEIASHLGLIETTPAEWDAKRDKARIRRECDELFAGIRRREWSIMCKRQDTLRALIRDVGSKATPLRWSILCEFLLPALERVETWFHRLEPDECAEWAADIASRDPAAEAARRAGWACWESTQDA